MRINNTKLDTENMHIPAGQVLPSSKLAFTQKSVINILGTFLLLILVLAIVFPTILIFINSMNGARPGQAFVFSLEGWYSTLTDPYMRDTLWNTIKLTVTRQLIAFPIAILIAWIIARTDIPHSRLLEFSFWLAFFLPTLPVLLAWILLLDPQYGLLNELLKLLPFINHPVFNIYSFSGIIWGHLITTTIAIKVMLLTPAFRNLDATIEEASRVSGASNIGTLIRISIPVLMPTILVTVIISLMNSLQAFEVEQILGKPFGFYVYSTTIYQVLSREPPLYANATVLSVIILLLCVPLILWQRSVSLKKRYTTVSGQYKGQSLKLRKWRQLAFMFVLIWAFLLTVVPMVFLFAVTFMKLFGYFQMDQPWTFKHWIRIFNDPIFFRSVLNTLTMSMGAALTAAIAFPLVAFVSVRTLFKGRAYVDYLSWLPHALPGIILGLGFLWAVLSTPFFTPFYGTLIILIIASVISCLPVGTQMTKSAILQIGLDLEEAGKVTGGTWLQVYRRIFIPLLLPMIITVAMITFVSAARNVSHVALLSTSANRPLALLQLDYMVQGSYESAAVVGVVVMVITTGVALLVRMLGFRLNIK